MSNTLIVDLAGQVAQQKCSASILGFRSVLGISSITGAQEDSLYPFVNAIDYRDNTKYSPAITSGTVEILITQSKISEIDYFAFAIHNSQDALLTGKLEVDDGTGFNIVAEFASIKSNRPFLVNFDAVNSSRQKLTLNFTSKLFIGSINIGKAVTFNRPPSIGFQPARTASLDKVEQFTTEGNNFIVGRRVNKGFQSTGGFRFVSFNDEINLWYEEYMNHVLDSKTIYFKWNKDKDETIYGLQNAKNLTKPTYSTSFHADINFDINGYA